MVRSEKNAVLNKFRAKCGGILHNIEGRAEGRHYLSIITPPDRKSGCSFMGLKARP